MKKIGIIGIAMVLMLSAFASAHTGFDSPQDIGELNQMHKDMILNMEPQDRGFHNQMHKEHITALAKGEDFDCPMH